jgi:hypothetical protein
MSKIYKISSFIFFIIISIISGFYIISVSYSQNTIETNNKSLDLMVKKEINRLKKDSIEYKIDKKIFAREDFKNLRDYNKKEIIK